jgi:hypothetical protein
MFVDLPQSSENVLAVEGNRISRLSEGESRRKGNLIRERRSGER